MKRNRRSTNVPQRRKPIKNAKKPSVLRHMIDFFRRPAEAQPEPERLFKDTRHDRYLPSHARAKRRLRWSEVYPGQRYPFNDDHYRGNWEQPK